MIRIDLEFRRSNGAPITYKGKTLVMQDAYEVPIGVSKLRFAIVSVNSEWRQGIRLETDGHFWFGDLKVGPVVVLWQDTAPRTDEFACSSRTGKIKVRNVWDTGTGTVESWYGNAAMIVSEKANGRRYDCNDGHFDEDFTDIIFEIETIG
ncbi:MAG: hypothetical protein AB1752_14720 [Candidatus Zixiibacteriota bacterium]